MILKQMAIVLTTCLMLQPALAGDLDQDLHWFKYVLQFSGMSQKEMQGYLNPFKGPTEFRLDKDHAPWAGNYFPMKDGGIAQRWRTEEHPVELHDKESLQALSAKELRNLSPVEKYDVMMGYYDFRTTKHELETRGPQRQMPPEDWEGFCNGVRCAGIMTPEPTVPVSVTNRDGITVQFSPADLKALAGASYFYVEKYGQLGGPTNTGRAANQPNAAAFDLVLRYHLARNQKGFVIDSHLGSEIWNETVVGYKRNMGEVRPVTARESELHPNAVNKVRVDVVLDTLGEVDIKGSNKLTQKKVADGSLLTTLETSYTLYLDQSGKAVDGQWHNKKGDTRGVDFAWFVGGKGADHLYAHQGGNQYLSFNRIRKLIADSVRPQCSRVF